MARMAPVATQKMASLSSLAARGFIILLVGQDYPYIPDHCSDGTTTLMSISANQRDGYHPWIGERHETRVSGRCCTPGGKNESIRPPIKTVLKIFTTVWLEMCFVTLFKTLSTRGAMVIINSITRTDMWDCMIGCFAIMELTS